MRCHSGQRVDDRYNWDYRASPRLRGSPRLAGAAQIGHRGIPGTRSANLGLTGRPTGVEPSRSSNPTSRTRFRPWRRIRGAGAQRRCSIPTMAKLNSEGVRTIPIPHRLLLTGCKRTKARASSRYRPTIAAIRFLCRTTSSTPSFTSSWRTSWHWGTLSWWRRLPV